MNPTPPKPRSIEATRLEGDYLARLHEALGRIPKSEAIEIEENVTEHIRAAVAELDTEEVRLSQMAAILEELGSPESLIIEPDDGPLPPPLPEDFLEAPSPEIPAMESRTGAREFLDRLFAGYLIVTVGLYVPIINLYFCSIIGFAVIWWNLRKAPTREIANSRKWAAIAMWSAIAMFPATLLMLTEQTFGILSLPIGIAWAVGDIALYWTVFGGLANWLESRGLSDLARKNRDRRIYYIVANVILFFLAIPLGLVVANTNDVMVSALIPYVLLPVAWVINWILILKPIMVIRRKIA